MIDGARRKPRWTLRIQEPAEEEVRQVSRDESSRVRVSLSRRSIKALLQLYSAHARLASRVITRDQLFKSLDRRAGLVEQLCLVAQLGTTKPLLARIDES